MTLVYEHSWTWIRYRLMIKWKLLDKKAGIKTKHTIKQPERRKHKS